MRKFRTAVAVAALAAVALLVPATAQAAAPQTSGAHARPLPCQLGIGWKG